MVRIQAVLAELELEPGALDESMSGLDPSARSRSNRCCGALGRLRDRFSRPNLERAFLRCIRGDGR